MWKAYLNFDAKIISLFQEGYNWLLDRTGTFVGNLIFLNAALAFLNVFQQQRYGLGAFGLFLGGLVAFPRIIIQAYGKNEIYNALAMKEEGSFFRHIFLVVNLTFLIKDCFYVDPGHLYWLEIFCNIPMQTMWYLFCIKIRDRDKKPFFEKKEELSLERAS